MIFSEVQTSGNRLVPDLSCIAACVKPPNPSRQFSVCFNELYEGAHPADRLYLVEADHLCWNISGRHLTELKIYMNNFLSRNDTQLRLSPAAVSCVCVRELCWCYCCTRHSNVNLITDWLAAVTVTNTLLKYTWRVRDTHSSLNTAASLWWISALKTPSVTRHLITIRWNLVQSESR